MAGFKQTIRNMDPVLFITFDGDTFDPGNGLLDSNSIMDESRYQNNGILQLGSDPTFYPPGYRAGQVSLVDLETTANHSMTFGYSGFQPTTIDKWLKAFVEVPNQTQYSMPAANGSFAISFMYNRSADENVFRNNSYWSGNTNTNTLSRMIVRKAGMIQFRYIDYWSSNDAFELTGPDNKIITIDSSEFNFSSYVYGKNTFFTITYNVEERQVGTFTCRLSLWINGIEMKFTEWQTVGAPPVVSTTSSWELMGTINSSNPIDAYNDRHTTPTNLDQLAVFNRAMTPTEVMDLFRKSRLYDDMIRASRPVHYYKFDDQTQVPALLYDYAGDWESGVNNRRNGLYLGGVGKIGNRVTGPATTYGAIGTSFEGGGCAVVHYNPNGYYPVWAPNSDNQSYEFWFKMKNGTRCVLYSNQTDDFPYNGHLVQGNWRNNAVVQGAIEVQFADDTTQVLMSKLADSTNRPYNFSDGFWHHLCVVRNGQRNTLYIDGVVHDEKDMARRDISGSGQIYFMGMMPEQLYTSGEMCNFAMYNRSLQVQEVQARVRYSQLYRIRGNVTLFGAAYAGTVRAYNHGTGALIKAVVANKDTGAYSIDLPNNDLVDLQALNPQDSTVRYRSYGPITPAQVEDLPQ